jgi:hypothetical protein
MNSHHWLEYFQRNRENRAEPRWHLPSPDSQALRHELARSLSHFQLGESGEGRFLLDQAEKTHPDDPVYAKALALFIGEEKEHARLLAELVKRFRGRLIHRHWTHFVFRLARRALGLNFEIQVLVIAELVGTAYYRLLHLRTRDPVLEETCHRMLLDEAKHIEFHAERFGDFHRELLPIERAAWGAQFQVLLMIAANVAWADHGKCLRALGAKRADFSKIARAECIVFLDAVSRCARPVRAGLGTITTGQPGHSV